MSATPRLQTTPPQTRQGWGVLLQLALLAGVLVASPPAFADQAAGDLVLHMLSYLRADYPEAVREGKVINAAEFAEMRDFAQQIARGIGGLPERHGKAELLASARLLQAAIEQRAAVEKIRALAATLSHDLVRLYGIVVAPRRPPALGAASALYQQNCASCHGTDGRGDGVLAANLDPPPTNFHDGERAAQRSVYGLYNAISLGVKDTAMQPFRAFSEEQRWALAFFVSQWAFDDATRARGADLWRRGAYRRVFADLGSISRLSPAEAADPHGPDGVAVLAYLRSHPKAVQRSGDAALAFALQHLKNSLAAYEMGEVGKAYQLALSAYLDGFELVESVLNAIDRAFVVKVEEAALRYRNLIQHAAPTATVREEEQRLEALLMSAMDRLQAGRLSPAVSFVGAFTILLREGLEAILILAAIVAFLAKAGHQHATRYVHYGWIGALAAGIGTWFAASRLVHISGASREATEGFTGLFAAGVLLYVGFWMHGKSHADQWRRFVDRKLSATLVHQRTLWLLAVLSFVVAYREAFETVLFYEVLWLQTTAEGHQALLLGFGAAVLGLLLVVWVVLKLSVRVPVGLFFKLNAAIMFILAIVFTGKGIAALQEAGRVPANPLTFPRVDALGIYPNVESLGVQGALLVIMAGLLIYTQLTTKRKAQD